MRVSLLSRPLSTLAPLPHLHVSTFSVVPTQLERTDPICVHQHGPTLRYVVKAFGSVKHERPSTSQRQFGEIRQAANVQTSLCTTESAKPLQSGSKDIALNQEQPWYTPSSPKSSWQPVGESDAPTWMQSGTERSWSSLEISGAPSPPKKRVCN